VTCYIQPCKPCKVTYILHYLPQGDESSPRGGWGICAPALPEVLTVDWLAIEQQRQTEMGRNNRIENASRISHDYKVGDKVLLKKSGKHLIKLETPRTGPHTVTAIYTNGTLCIQKGKINER
jgi:hypothetical protein